MGRGGGEKEKGYLRWGRVPSGDGCPRGTQGPIVQAWEQWDGEEGKSVGRRVGRGWEARMVGPCVHCSENRRLSSIVVPFWHMPGLCGGGGWGMRPNGCV